MPSERASARRDPRTLAVLSMFACRRHEGPHQGPGEAVETCANVVAESRQAKSLRIATFLVNCSAFLASLAQIRRVKAASGAEAASNWGRMPLVMAASVAKCDCVASAIAASARLTARNDLLCQGLGLHCKHRGEATPDNEGATRA